MFTLGIHLDEVSKGQGLRLAIVADVVSLYSGKIAMGVDNLEGI